MHLDEQAAAVLVGPQAAPPVRQRLRQHRHHPVREIAAIAALPCIPVERRIRAHVMGDVRYRHQQPKTVARRFGIDRVVEIPRVLAVDGDQRRVPQIGALGRAAWPRARFASASASGENSVGISCVWMQIRLTERGIPNAAQPLHHPRMFEPVRRAGQRLGQHDLPLQRAGAFASRNAPLRLGAPVGRHQPVRRPEHAQDTPRRVRQAFEGAPLVAARPDRLQPGKHPLTRRQRRLATRLARHENGGRRAIPLPLHRPGHRVAVRIGPRNADNNSIRQTPRRRKTLVPGRGHIALAGQVAQQIPQRRPVLRPQLERPRDLPLARHARRPRG